MRFRIAATFYTMFLLPLMALAGQQTDDSVVHGTINIALGNENGLVVLTDSMITTGGRPHPEKPSQKLFKLDDRTVCAIAGFAAADAISAPPISPPASVPDLNTSTSAIIHEYTRKSAAQAPQSIAEKLRALAILMRLHLSAIANVRDALGNPTPIDSYRFQLIVAGYDTDDKLKIGKITLMTKNDRGNLMSDLDEASVVEVKETLVWKLNGMPEIAEQLLLDPKSQPNDAVLRQYDAARLKDGGRSLTVEQMEELAKKLKQYTQERHPEVGGPEQIAIFQKHDAVSIQQRNFPDPPKPLVNFNLFVKSSFVGSNAIVVAKGISSVFVRCSWSTLQRELDDNYFINNEFRDSFLTYDGGAMNLGETNRIINSKLIVGPNVKPGDKTLQKLRTAFPWSQTLYVVPAVESWKGVPYPIPMVVTTEPPIPDRE
jgi:20S proteasome alpha/beta subunit